MPRRLSLFLWLAIVACAWVGAAPARAQARGAGWEAVECATFKVESREAECGYVAVPELHEQPAARQLKLAVVVIRNSRGVASPGAFVMAQGGPGGSTIDTFAKFMLLGYYPALKRLRAERDIVLYDQRGTLYAQPALVCPEEMALTQQTIDKEIRREELDRRSIDAALACRARLASQGVNLAAYNSRENARDIETLRQALGYERFDFYGVSYGTLLALHAMRQVPTAFRSVVLDAVVPTQLNPNETVARTMNASFERLFSACAADADCSAAYPDLKKVFYDQVDALNRKPARVRITDPDENKTYDAVLDGDELLSLLFQFIYNSDLVPALPKMIYDVRAGQYPLIERYWALLAFDRTFASGMYYSTTCSEDADFTVEQLDLNGVDPHIAAMEQDDTATLLELCQKWNVPPLGASFDQPVKSAVPTLVLSGDFDPITPPPFGQAAAATLSAAYVYDFPAYGHGALTSGDCPNELILAFVRDPQSPPNASCLAGVGHVAFVTPRGIIMSPGLGSLMYSILELQLAPFLAPAVLLMLLGSVWIVGPVAWLVATARKRPGDPRLTARLSPWLAALGTVLAGAFFVGLAAVALSSVLNPQNSVSLLFGIPRSLGLLLALPLLFALCALGLLAATGAAWRSSYWGVGFRVYMSGLTLAAVALTIWFAASGALFAFLA